MTSAEHSPPRDEIHIYADGTWLPKTGRKARERHPVRNNPADAGGWGAVIFQPGGGFSQIEGTMSGWSGQIHSSTDAEIAGVLYPLLDIAHTRHLPVTPKEAAERAARTDCGAIPKIVLHMDEESIISVINKLRNDNDAASTSFTQEHKDFPILLDAIRAMNVTVEYTAASKSLRKAVEPHCRWMDKAHDIAYAQALHRRKFLQNDEIYIPVLQKRVRGRDADEAIESIGR